MTRYSTIRCTRSVLGGVVENQLPDVRALPALVKVEADFIQRCVDLQLQRHRLFGLVADAVIGAKLEAIEGIELVNHVDALLANPDRERIANLVGHTHAHTPTGGKSPDMEATA